MKKEERSANRKCWINHLKKWKAGGLTQAEYCRQNELSDKSFYYWKRRFEIKNKSISFVKLPDLSDLQNKHKNIHSNNSLKVLIGNELQIELNDNFNPETLKKAVQALRSI